MKNISVKAIGAAVLIGCMFLTGCLQMQLESSDAQMRMDALSQVPSEKLAYIVWNVPLSYSSLKPYRHCHWQRRGSPETAQYPDDIRVAAIDRMYNEGMITQLCEIAEDCMRGPALALTSDEVFIRKSITAKFMTLEGFTVLANQAKASSDGSDIRSLYHSVLYQSDDSLIKIIAQRPELIIDDYCERTLVEKASDTQTMLVIVTNRTYSSQTRITAAKKLFKHGNVAGEQILAALGAFDDLGENELAMLAEEGLKAAKRIGATDVVQALEGE